MQADGKKQNDSRSPQKCRERLQQSRVVIDFFGGLENLEIAEQMADHKPNRMKPVTAMIAFLPTVVCQKRRLPAERFTTVALMEETSPSVCNEGFLRKSGAFRTDDLSQAELS